MGQYIPVREGTRAGSQEATINCVQIASKLCEPHVTYRGQTAIYELAHWVQAG
jgi:hypothetical protein